MSSEIEKQAEEIAQRVAGLSPATVEKAVLVYFDIIGICWPIRCLLHLKHIDYELVKVPIEMWAYTTPNGDQPLVGCFRNGHLPLYVDPQVSLTQGNVIMTYLAEKHDLLGDSGAEKLAAMEVMAHAYDALFHWSGLFQILIKMDTPDDVVESRLQAFLGNGTWGVLTNGYRRNLDPFERYMDANSDKDSGFIVGSRLSIADLHAFNVLCNWYKAFDRALFVEQYPRLDDYVRRIGANPEVADYIRHRQEPTTWFPYPRLAIKLTTPEELAGLTAPL